MKDKGIPEDIKPHHYLKLKNNTIDYSSQPTADTSFGIVPPFLLDKILKMNGSNYYHEEQNVSHIRLKAGRQAEGTGFGARHILSIGSHIDFILTAISSQLQSTECHSLVKFLVQLNLSNIDKIETSSYGLALEKRFQRFVLALKITQLDVLQHMLIILFPDGFDFMIGTLYPISEKLFLKIKHGNERYIPIDNNLSSVTLPCPVPAPSNSNLEKPQEKTTEPKQQVDENNNNVKTSEKDEEKTYKKVMGKLKKNRNSYLTTLKNLIEDKMVTLSECYFMFNLEKPSHEERKTYMLMCQLDIEKEPVKADICVVFKNYEKIQRYYNDTLEEINKFIALKNLSPEINCQKLTVYIRTLGVLLLNFCNETSTLIKKSDTLLALLQKIAKYLVTSDNTRKIFGHIQDNFDDIFVHSENKDRQYWNQVINKIKEHSKDITAIPEFVSTYNSCSNVSTKILTPTFAILKKENNQIQENIEKIINMKQKIFYLSDILNVKLVKTANNLLRNFIDIQGRGLLNNKSLPVFFTNIINKNKDTLALSCDREKESKLLDEFVGLFQQYQYILINNDKILMYDHEVSAPSSSK